MAPPVPPAARRHRQTWPRPGAARAVGRAPHGAGARPAGVLIALERLFLSKVLGRLPVFISHTYLIFIAIFGWVIFYFTDLSRLGSYLGVMTGLSGHTLWDIALSSQLQANIIWFLIALIFCMPVAEFLKAKLENKITDKQLRIMPYAQTALNVVMLLVSVSFLVGKSYNPFLYFRF